MFENRFDEILFETGPFGGFLPEAARITAKSSSVSLQTPYPGTTASSALMTSPFSVTD